MKKKGGQGRTLTAAASFFRLNGSLQLWWARGQLLHEFVEKSLALIEGLNAHTLVPTMKADVVAIHKEALYPIAWNASASQISAVRCAHHHDWYDRNSWPQFVG